MRGSLQVGTDGDDLCVPGTTHVVGNESRGSNGFVRGVDGARSGEEVFGTEGVTRLGCGGGMVLGVVVLEGVAGLGCGRGVVGMADTLGVAGVMRMVGMNDGLGSEVGLGRRDGEDDGTDGDRVGDEG